ncbi:hypothetical protein [Carnobacterium maltaromaticum]
MLIERLDISRQNRESIEKTIKKNQYIYVSGEKAGCSFGPGPPT